MEHTPIPDSYWLVPGKFLAGEYPGARDEAVARQRLCVFLAAGISLFLDLTEPDEGLVPYESWLQEEASRGGRQVQYCRIAIPDLGVPSVAQMREIQQVIATALQSGQALYVHCWGGIGRTGTVVACYLVGQGLSSAAALAEIARLRRATPDGWRASPETRAQVAFIEAWQSSAQI